MSSDPEQEYFSDGLSEELLNLLAKSSELRVTSRSSAFYFKNKEFKIAEIGRELNVAHARLGIALLKKGDPEAALVAVEADSLEAFRLFGRAIAYHSLGNVEESDAALAELIELWADEAAYQVAEAHAHRSENQSALDWLERAYENRDGGMPYMPTDIFFESLRGDPRFEDLVERMGLTPE